VPSAPSPCARARAWLSSGVVSPSCTSSSSSTPTSSLAALKVGPVQRTGSALRKFHHITGIWRALSNMIVPLRR
jgi:hypothetical protein